MYNGRDFKLSGTVYTIYETKLCPQSVLSKVRDVSAKREYYIVVWPCLSAPHRLNGVSYGKEELESNIECGTWKLFSNDPLLKELLKVLEVK